MNLKQQKAITTFKAGNNCAQSVLSAFSEKLNFDYELASQMSSGFGGGMGKLQETCGAVTGAYMVIGIQNSKSIEDIDLRRKEAVQKVKAFSESFKTLNQYTDCKSLVGCDIKTAEGIKYLKDHQLDVVICEKCITDAVNILDALFSSNN